MRGLAAAKFSVELTQAPVAVDADRMLLMVELSGPPRSTQQ
jgi:hypothetical protein